MEKVVPDPGVVATSIEPSSWSTMPRTTARPSPNMAAIDRGNYKGAAHGRHWTLDPIDGTKGFLRGEQYAVCLALIEDGEVVLGVLGCPHLPVSGDVEQGPVGSTDSVLGGEPRRPDGRRRADGVHLAIGGGVLEAILTWMNQTKTPF